MRHRAESVRNYWRKCQYLKEGRYSLFKLLTLSSATTGCLLILAQSGLFQSMEVKSFDILTQLTTHGYPFIHNDRDLESPIVVIAITEEDIQQQQRWPFPDKVFADLLLELQRHEPAVIGLNIYRDVPHYPGTKALAQQLRKENVVAIAHLDQLGKTKIPSPLSVSDDRVGFDDFVVDPDGVVRRNFMFAAIDDRHLYSFSLRLVERFLIAQGAEVIPELNALNISGSRLLRLTQNSGGYQKIDPSGYQSLSRYYAPDQIAREISVTQLLEGDFNPDWIREKVVLIGTTAPSQQNLFYTPFSFGSGESLVTSGVVLHAQMVRQLLGIVMKDRSQLLFLPQWGEFVWIWLWGAIAGLLIWRFTHPGVLLLSATGGILALFTTSLILFNASVWLPVALPTTAFLLTLTGLICYREFYQSFYDSVTGLPNRTLLIQQLKKLIRPQNRTQIAVVLFDIDKFKSFNESFGLQVGDRLLQIIANRIQSALLPNQRLARIAGDEFVILLTDIINPEAVVAFARKLSEQVTRPITLTEKFEGVSENQRLFPTVSTGIAFSQSDTLILNAEDLLRDAQTAISRAKAQGRGNCEVFVPTMRSHVSAKLGLEADLREALVRQEFVLHYQPLICLKSMRLAGFEALIRWHHPQRGVISPGEFIPLAEDTGMIIPIGQWVLETACAQAKQWQEQLHKKLLGSCSNEQPPNRLFMSVNLSARQFTQKDLVKRIDCILKETELNPFDLKLELTESVVMNNVEASIEVLLQLKSLGLQVGIDDFGTGYSSLSYLHRFPIDTLKVDRSFVMEMESPEGTAELVRTIVALGHNLGMSVVAEGIETESQSQKLQALRCEYGQGYLFSRPLPVKEATNLIFTEL